MPTFFLLLPFGIITIASFALIHFYDWPYWPILVSLTFIVMGLVFKYQINWWWYSKFPPKMDKQTRHLLNRNFPYYMALGPTERKRFETRMLLFLEAKEFSAVDLDKMPGDIRCLIGACAARLCFGLDDFILDWLSQVSVYKSLFISPQARQPHANELHKDGAILLAIDRLLMGINNNPKGFDIALYEFARILKIELKLENSQFPIFNDPIIEDKLLALCGKSKEFMFKHLGHYRLNLFALSVEIFFHHPAALKEAFPEHFEQLMGILKQNPINKRNPLILGLVEQDTETV